MARVIVVSLDDELANECAHALARFGHEVRRCDLTDVVETIERDRPALLLVDGNDAAALLAVRAIEARVRGLPVLVILNRDNLTDVFATMQNIAPN